MAVLFVMCILLVRCKFGAVENLILVDLSLWGVGVFYSFIRQQTIQSCFRHGAVGPTNQDSETGLRIAMHAVCRRCID